MRFICDSTHGKFTGLNVMNDKVFGFDIYIINQNALASTKFIQVSLQMKHASKSKEKD